MAQAIAHKTVIMGCLAHCATYRVATTTQSDQEWKSTLHGLHAEVNKAWKDANDVIFSHMLRYDSQLVAFITSAEGTHWDKHMEVWRCMHSLTNTAKISP